MFDAVTYAAAVNKAKATILPAGGGEGQVLGKDADGNTTWVDNAIAENAIVTSDTQPESPATKIWIDEGAEEIEIPTMEEVSQLSESIDEIDNYNKTMNYDTRIVRASELVAGHYEDSVMLTTRGNYAYYRSTPIIPIQDVQIFVNDETHNDLIMVVSVFDAENHLIAHTRNGTHVTDGVECSAKWMTSDGKYNATYFAIGFYRYPFAEITSKITICPLNDIDNIAKKTVLIENATLDKMKIEFDKTQFENGYIKSNGDVEPSSGYLASPFIKVTSNMVVTIKNMITANWVICAFYDADKNCIGYLPYNRRRTENVQSIDVFIPSSTAYIRYTVSQGMISITDCVYKMKDIPAHYLASSLMEMWSEQSFGKIGKLFKSATEKPLITIIDDDTHTTQVVTNFYNACIAKGIVGSFAIITRRLDDDTTLKDTLLSFEDAGFGCYAHCTDQNSKWSTMDYTAIEEDMKNCVRKLYTAGFTNFKYWLTPGGHVEPKIQELGKRLGMRCMVSSGWREIETTEAKYGRYGIRRCTLEAEDASGALTVDDFKKLVDDAVACNGWLLITTHFGNGKWDETAVSERFNVIVDYAKSKGMKFTTLAEAFETREPIYRFYEMF